MRTLGLPGLRLLSVCGVLVLIGCKLGLNNNSANHPAGDAGSTDAAFAHHGCYQGGGGACQDVTWNDVSGAINLLYTLKDTYAGYTKAEATDLAREVYDHGAPQGAWVRVLAAQALPDGGYRAFVSVAGDDGLSRSDLSAADVKLSIDGAAAIAPTKLTRLGDATLDDVHAQFSIVVDDSGSVQDCDATFVSKGLAHLFAVTPPIYSADLLKFDTEVLQAAPRTDDHARLEQAATDVCTNRGGTALWDAMDQALSGLPKDGDLRALLVFTDGLDNASSVKRSEISARAAKDKVAMFVVALGFADVLSLNRLFADGASGGLVYVPSGERILRGFEQVTDFINDAYVVEWEGDAGAKRVKVQVGSHSNTFTL